MNSRRGPRRDEESSFDYNNGAGPNSNYRGNPSNRNGPTSTQAPSQVPPISQNNQVNLDLEGAAFPPLPGSASASSKNGDSPYEGR